ARSDRQIRPILESLEDRTLPAVIPPIQLSGQVDVSLSPPDENKGGGGGHYDTPSIQVNPVDRTQLASVCMPHDEAVTGTQKSFIDLSISTTSGSTWPTTVLVSSNDCDPHITNTCTPLAQATDASVGWDRAGFIYVVWSEHRADYTFGKIL